MERSRESAGTQVSVGAGRDKDPQVQLARLLADPENLRITADVTHAGKARDWDQVVSAFHGAGKPDTMLYNAAMDAAKKCGRYEEGLQLFGRMRDEGVWMSPVSYHTAIRLLGKLGRYAESKSLWEERKLMGLPEDAASLGVAYGAILEAAGHSGQVRDALQLLQEAHSRGAKHHVHFGMALTACAVAGDAIAARELLGRLEEGGHPLDVVQLTAAMASYKSEALSEQQKLHELVLSRHIQPNEHYYAAFICSLLRGIDFDSGEAHRWPPVLRGAGNERLRAVLGALAEMRRAGCPAKRLVRNAEQAMRRNAVEVEFRAGPDVGELGFFIAGFPPEASRVVKVTVGSWAEAAGWSVGDLLAAVNGRPAASAYSADELKAALRERPVSLTIRLH